jgi:hypothetical protein
MGQCKSVIPNGSNGARVLIASQGIPGASIRRLNGRFCDREPFVCQLPSSLIRRTPEWSDQSPFVGQNGGFAIGLQPMDRLKEGNRNAMGQSPLEEGRLNGRHHMPQFDQYRTRSLGPAFSRGQKYVISARGIAKGMVDLVTEHHVTNAPRSCHTGARFAHHAEH